MPVRVAAYAGLFLVFVLLLGIGLQAAGVAEAFSDELGHIRAQDESMYANGALTMATDGSWMTPKFLGRYMLFKPPLLVWLSALSLKLFGSSVAALRLPILLTAAFATLLLVIWSAKTHSLWTSAATGLLLVANPLWHTFSRLCYTDMLVTAAVVAAIFTFWRDLELSRWHSVLLFAFSVAAAIMSKSVAGILPLGVLVLFCLLARRRVPAGFWKALGIVLLLVAPWHIYQAVVHGRWFWTEYVQVQLLGFGLKPPIPVPPAVPFYVKRLAFTDPVLCLLVLFAVPFFWRAGRERKSEAILLFSWLVVVAASLLAFQFRNLPYLLQLIPPLCLVATGYNPLFFQRHQRIAVGALAAISCLKVILATPPWGFSYGEPIPLPSAVTLRWYAGLSRANELIAVNTDDEFSASITAIRKVRYVFIDPGGTALLVAPHYHFLGITTTAAEFEHLKILEPVYRQRLLDWGLDSTEPVATTIFATSTDEVLRMIASLPQTDFYLPPGLRAAVLSVPNTAHRFEPIATGRFLLLAMDSHPVLTKKPSLE
jgi:4-amino-4-deoxy-L-arabinose transferase-like glycosyltransferase